MLQAALEKMPYRLPWDPVPKHILRRMPFEKEKYKMAISCHKLFGTFVVNRASSNKD